MEESEKASPKRRSFGFRVALQFPTRKSAEKRAPDKIFSKSCLVDSKRTSSVTRMKSNKWKKADQENSSESEEDAKEASDESSSALLKRAMNIKENKAMVSLHMQQQHYRLNIGVNSSSLVCINNQSTYWGNCRSPCASQSQTRKL